MAIYVPVRTSNEVRTSKIGESTESLTNRVEAIERQIVNLRKGNDFVAIERLVVKRNELLFALASR